MEKYEFVRNIGMGTNGAVCLMRDRDTSELVAIKYIARGQILNSVTEEIMNHRSLRHPNIIGFKRVICTPTHLGIVMEYGAGGDLFDQIKNGGHICEEKARFFFQQLISGVSYCHRMQIYHGDLKLENMVLDSLSPSPRLKICDFGASNSLVGCWPEVLLGTIHYMAPEYFMRDLLAPIMYDGQITDVWSCGVILYVMMVGALPQDPRKTIRLGLSGAWYKVPDSVAMSIECRDLLSRIFVANPGERITIPEIKNHEWFLKNLPVDFEDVPELNDVIESQSEEEVSWIINECKTTFRPVLPVEPSFLASSPMEHSINNVLHQYL